MKIRICTINLNEEEGRQTIYLNTEDHLLYTDYDDTECPSVPCYSIEDASEAAWSLWGKTPGWDLEWIEHDFTYYLTQRPAGPGCQPRSGLVEIVDLNNKFVPEINRTAWSKVIYDRQLTQDEINQYELTPAVG